MQIEYHGPFTISWLRRRWGNSSAAPDGGPYGELHPGLPAPGRGLAADGPWRWDFLENPTIFCWDPWEDLEHSMEMEVFPGKIMEWFNLI